MTLPSTLSTANGKISFGYKELLQFAVLTIGIGSAWAGLQAKAGQLEKADELLETKVASVKSETSAKLDSLETQSDADHDLLNGVQKDVEQLGKDVQEVKASQAKMQESIQKQQIDTATILAEIRQLKPKEIR